MSGQYRYEARGAGAAGRCKHRWNRPNPGFVADPDGRLEGKCPANLPLETVEKLLETGIHDSPPGWRKDHPKIIYNIYQGAVYKALESVPGESYHGFPCLGARASRHRPASDMTQRVQELLMERAREQGCEEAIEAWFREQPVIQEHSS